MTLNATPQATFKIFAPMLKSSRGDDGRMRLHGVASSTVVDRHGDTMARTALDDMLAAANSGLTIFLNHSYNVPEDVAGTVEAARIKSMGDIHDLAFDVVINDKNPRAVSAWEAINSGTKLGLSIGAMIPEGGASRDRQSGAYMIDHVELLETSLVGVPANPRSWVEYAVKALRSNEPDSTNTITITSAGVEPVVPEAVKEAIEDDLGFAPVHEPVEKELEAEELDHTDDPDEDADYAADADPEVADVAPDISDATVSIETPFANITVDTGNRGGSKAPAASDDSSQEAQLSEPETEEPTNPWSAIGLSGDELLSEETRPVAIDAITALSPAVVASLKSGTDLLRAITGELIEARRSLAQTREERDAAVTIAQQVMANTKDILDKLAATPVGRKATYVEAEKRFDDLRGVYGDDFLNLLRRTSR
jgi:HK97 family phage prohead protease